jgi:hypothetical protein
MIAPLFFTMCLLKMCIESYFTLPHVDYHVTKSAVGDNIMVKLSSAVNKMQVISWGCHSSCLQNCCWHDMVEVFHFLDVEGVTDTLYTPPYL